MPIKKLSSSVKRSIDANSSSDVARSRAFWIGRVAEMQRALRRIIRTPNRDLYPWTAKQIARDALRPQTREKNRKTRGGTR